MDKLGRAYGAGLAGGGFDPVNFIKKPHVVLRIVSWVFSIVVFGCISSGAWIMKNDIYTCVYSDSPGTCGFGTAIGVLSFIACTIFIIVDAYFENISSVQLRKRVVIGDLATSAVGLFFWFITFCVLTNKWVTREEDQLIFPKSSPQAAIAFSFFSIITWGGLLLFAFRRYKEGAASAFAPTYEQDFSAAGAPPFYPGVGGVDSYQEPPFTASNDAAGLPQYQQPAY